MPTLLTRVVRGKLLDDLPERWRYRLERGLALAVVATMLFSSAASAQEEAPESLTAGSTEAAERAEHAAALARDLLERVKRADAHAEELRAPEFPERKDWFNAPPLRFDRELKGKIVVLDFWTFCCINCIHVLPDLAALEEKYSGYPVAFVGVHSAKFDNEKRSENVREAVLRYEIEHAVINDDEMVLWKRLGVRSWPTLVVVGPKQNLLLMVSGEGQKSVIDACIQAALTHYPPEVFRHDPVPRTPLRRAASGPGAVRSALRFPGKLAVDAAKKRLYISDSSQHRIVVTDLDGNFIEAIGSGRRGLRDGSYSSARFNRLQGLAIAGDLLYVADAENHALRQVDLEKKEVSTLVGDGTQGHDRSGGGRGREQRISTPWDVFVYGDRVYIAMAGTHQIWVYKVEDGVCENYSGNGREQNYNSPDRLQAAWSQPSSLTLGDGWLFVADSESSSIRGIQLASGNTRSFVGGDDAEARNLFAFGDEDGKGDSARLQHPLGVHWLPGTKRVLVADTYNHRLKLVNHVDRSVRTVWGSGEAGLADGRGSEAQFSEPSGFAAHPDGKRVFVADTNNHAIRLIDLESEDVTTLELKGVPAALSPVAAGTRRLADLPGTDVVRSQPLKLAVGETVTISLKIELPAEHHYTARAMSAWQILNDSRDAFSVADGKSGGRLEKDTETITVEVKRVAEGGVLRIEALAYFCREQGACQIGAVIFEIPVESGAQDRERVELTYRFREMGAGLTTSPFGWDSTKEETDTTKGTKNTKEEKERKLENEEGDGS